MHPWFRTHAPTTLKGIIGQDSATRQLYTFVTGKRKKQAMLLYGPTGVGKSVMVHALGKELGLEVIEVNASDRRNADSLEQMLGNALRQQSLFGTGKIVLVDEIDGLSGNQDRGGVQAILKLLPNAAFPVVITANDPGDSKFSSLRQKCVMVECPALESAAITGILAAICEKEGIVTEEAGLKALSRRAAGDCRAAINDLQTLAAGGPITTGRVELLGERNRVESLSSAITRILKTTQPDVALASLDAVQEQPEETFLWLDENTAREYTKSADLARAYRALSLADVLRSRIMRRQHWRLLVYVNAMLTAGVALAKEERYQSKLTVNKPTRILSMWKAKMKHQRRKAIAEKLAAATHCSRREAFTSLVYLKEGARNTAFLRELTESLELDDEEAGWLA